MLVPISMLNYMYIYIMNRSLSTNQQNHPMFHHAHLWLVTEAMAPDGALVTLKGMGFDDLIATASLQAAGLAGGCVLGPTCAAWGRLKTQCSGSLWASFEKKGIGNGED